MPLWRTWLAIFEKVLFFHNERLGFEGHWLCDIACTLWAEASFPLGFTMVFYCLEHHFYQNLWFAIAWGFIYGFSTVFYSLGIKAPLGGHLAGLRLCNQIAAHAIEYARGRFVEKICTFCVMG